MTITGESQGKQTQQGQQRQPRKSISLSPIRNRRKRRSWLSAIGQGRSPASTRRRERSGETSKNSAARKRFDVDSLSFSGLERQHHQSPRSPASPSSTGNWGSSRPWSPPGTPPRSPRSPRSPQDRRRLRKNTAAAAATATVLAEDEGVATVSSPRSAAGYRNDDDSPPRSATLQSITIPTVFPESDPVGPYNVCDDDGECDGVVEEKSSVRKKLRKSPMAAHDDGLRGVDAWQSETSSSTLPRSAGGRSPSTAVTMEADDTVAPALLDPTPATATNSVHPDLSTSVAIDDDARANASSSEHNKDPVSMAQKALGEYWKGRNAVGMMDSPPESEDGFGDGSENGDSCHSHPRNMLRISTEAQRGSIPSLEASIGNISAQTLGSARDSIRSRRSDAREGGAGWNITLPLTPEDRGKRDARRRISSRKRVTPGGSGCGSSRSMGVSPGAISMATPVSPSSHSGFTSSPLGSAAAVRARGGSSSGGHDFSALLLTSPTLQVAGGEGEEGSSHSNTVNPAAAAAAAGGGVRFSLGRRGKFDSFNNSPRGSSLADTGSQRRLPTISSEEGRSGGPVEPYANTDERMSSSPPVSPFYASDKEMSWGRPPSPSKMPNDEEGSSPFTTSAAAPSPVGGVSPPGDGWSPSARGLEEWQQQLPQQHQSGGFVCGSYSRHTAPLSATSSTSFGCSAAFGLPADGGKGWILSSSVSPSRAGGQVTRDTAGIPRRTTPRHNRSRTMTLGSEMLSLASASNLPTVSDGFEKLDSPERTTPDKMPPFAPSEDSPERTGTGDVFGGGCGGSGAVGHAPDLYEFLSAVGSGATGGGKMFPVEGDDSTGAAAVSGEELDRAREEHQEDIRSCTSSCASPYTDLCPSSPRSRQLSPYSQAKTSMNSNLAVLSEVYPETSGRTSESSSTISGCPFPGSSSSDAGASEGRRSDGIPRLSTAATQGSISPVGTDLSDCGSAQRASPSTVSVARAEVLEGVFAAATVTKPPSPSLTTTTTTATTSRPKEGESRQQLQQQMPPPPPEHAGAFSGTSRHVPPGVTMSPLASKTKAEKSVLSSGGSVGEEGSGRAAACSEGSQCSVDRPGDAAAGPGRGCEEARRSSLLVSTPTGDGGPSDLSLWVTTREEPGPAASSSSSPDSVMQLLERSCGVSPAVGEDRGRDSEKSKSSSTSVVGDKCTEKNSTSKSLSPSAASVSSGNATDHTVSGNDPRSGTHDDAGNAPQNEAVDVQQSDVATAAGPGHVGSGENVGCYASSPAKGDRSASTISSYGGEQQRRELEPEPEPEMEAGAETATDTESGDDGGDRLAEKSESVPLLAAGPHVAVSGVSVMPPRDRTGSCNSVLSVPRSGARGMWGELSRFLCGLLRFCVPPQGSSELQRKG